MKIKNKNKNVTLILFNGNDELHIPYGEKITTLELMLNIISSFSA